MSIEPESFLYTFDDSTGVATITLNRPDRLNALTFEIYRELFEFGYGTDRCRVFNYWHDDYPVAVDGIDARTLVIANGPEAIVVVTDYGDGGHCRVKLDMEKLGLGRNAEAEDLETDEAIERAGAGEFEFDLKKHDFRILRIR